MWDGTAQELKDNFVGLTGVTFPVLMMGSETAVAYNATLQEYLILGTDGIVVYIGYYPLPEDVNPVVDSLLAEKSSIMPRIPISRGRGSARLVDMALTPSVLQVSFTLFDEQNIRMALMDARGREYVELVNKFYPAGSHSFRWNVHSEKEYGSRVPGAGMYILTFESENVRKAETLLYFLP